MRGHPSTASRGGQPTGIAGPARALLVGAAILAVAACAPSQPSAVPTASQAEPNPNLLAFEQRAAAGITRQGELIRSLAGASAGSEGELGLVARLLNQWAADELAWLGDHPAEPCYEKAADAYRTGLTDVATAAEAFATLAAASAPPTNEDGQAAAQSLTTGRRSLEQAAACS